MSCPPLTIFELTGLDRPYSPVKCKNSTVDAGQQSTREDTPKCTQSNSTNCPISPEIPTVDPGDEPTLGASNPSEQSDNEPMLGAPNPSEQPKHSDTMNGNQPQVPQTNNSMADANNASSVTPSGNSTEETPTAKPGEVAPTHSEETRPPANATGAISPSSHNGTATADESAKNDTEQLTSADQVSNDHKKTNGTGDAEHASAAQNATKPLESGQVNGTQTAAPTEPLPGTATPPPTNGTNATEATSPEPKVVDAAAAKEQPGNGTTPAKIDDVELRSNSTGPNTTNDAGSAPKPAIEPSGVDNSTKTADVQSADGQNVTSSMAPNSADINDQHNQTSLSSIKANETQPAEPRNDTQPTVTPVPAENGTVETVSPRPPPAAPTNVTAAPANETLPTPPNNQINSDKSPANESAVAPATPPANQTAPNATETSNDAQAANSTQTNDTSIALPATIEPSRDNGNNTNASGLESGSQMANATSAASQVAQHNATDVVNNYFEGKMSTDADGKQHYSMNLKQPMKLSIDYVPDCTQAICCK